MVLGDARHGTTAYRMNGAVPVRSLAVPLGGTIAWYGNTSAVLWRGVVPADLNPVVVGPAAGYVLSGNNAPVGPWYPIPLGPLASGDSARSRRVRELLSGEKTGVESLHVPPITPAHVHNIHFDSVAVVPRDVARLAAAAGPTRLTSPAARALLPWLAQWINETGGDIAAESTTAAVAWALAPSLRWHGKTTTTPLTDRFGEGTNGLQYMLRKSPPAS
jgi:penicillin amidase